ncbi:MAG: hypothetical protein ACREEB_19000 [Caulobacteraceae bacterium]
MKKGDLPVPMMQTVLGKLNANMSRENIRTFARNDAARYAHGEPLHEALADHGADPGELHDAFRDYLQRMPGAISEALRATIHYALSTTPPTLVTFSWAPSYDYEIDIWQAPDTKATKGGVTVLFKSRYPDHPHPLA